MRAVAGEPDLCVNSAIATSSSERYDRFMRAVQDKIVGSLQTAAINVWQPNLAFPLVSGVWDEFSASVELLLSILLLVVAAASAALEHVNCNLCRANDPETVYAARDTNGKPRDVVRTYRASGDELLMDQLVRCRHCGLEYVSPRPRGTDIVDAYSRGDDPAYVSQLAARERTFSNALARIESVLPGRGRLLDVGTAAGAFLAAARARGWRWKAANRIAGSPNGARRITA